MSFLATLEVELPESEYGAHYESNRISDSTLPRCFNVYYTNYGTQLTVEDGLLVEKPQPSFIGPFQELPPSPRIDSDEDEDDVTGELAEAALDYYNSKRSKKYKLVKPIAFYGDSSTGRLWYHVNFKAKPKESDGVHEDSSTRLFFAEMRISWKKKSGLPYAVSVCHSLAGCKTVEHCGMCTGGIIHGIGKFRFGLLSGPRLRPRYG